MFSARAKKSETNNFKVGYNVDLIIVWECECHLVAAEELLCGEVFVFVCTIADENHNNESKSRSILSSELQDAVTWL